jgi:predicted nucleotidyltransferase
MPSKFLPLPTHIVERLKALPQRVATLEGLIALWLFGSFARDAWTPISDVDLAYLACEGWQDDALDRFEARLYSTITTLSIRMTSVSSTYGLLLCILPGAS